MRRFVVGVMGQGESTSAEIMTRARELGRLIALEGWAVLSGGRDSGVMKAVNQGAKTVEGSLTVGILPDAQAAPSPDLDLVIVTEMHNARNNINVLSSDVIVAFAASGAGTVSEIALAIKAGKSVILLDADPLASEFFRNLGKHLVQIASTPFDAIQMIHHRFGTRASMSDCISASPC